MATATCDKTCSSMQQETRGQTLMMFMDCSSNPWSNGSCWIIMVDPFPLLLFCQATLPSSIDSWFVNCFLAFQHPAASIFLPLIPLALEPDPSASAVLECWPWLDPCGMPMTKKCGNFPIPHFDITLRTSPMSRGWHQTLQK